MRRARKRAKPRPKVDLTWLHAYEEALIASDIASGWPQGATVSARELRLRYPMRYSETMLPRVLARMHKAGRLTRLKNTRTRKWTYGLSTEALERSAA